MRVLLGIATVAAFCCATTGSAVAGTVAMSGAKLTFQASPGETNVVAINDQGGGSFGVADSSNISDGDGVGGCAVTNGKASCPGVMSIAVDAGDGDDTVCFTTQYDPQCIQPRPSSSYFERLNRSWVFPQLPTTIEGGPGDDVLHGGDGDDVLNGGPGRDWLYGHQGNLDRLNGGDGSDDLEPNAYFKITSPPPGAPEELDHGFNVMDGGTGADDMRDSYGYDTVDYSSRTAKVSVDTVNANATYAVQGEVGEHDMIGRVESVLTGSGADRVQLGDTVDWYHVLPALIDTGAGKDFISVVHAWGEIHAGAGADRVRVNNATVGQIIYGDDGDDKLLGSPRDDTIYGGPGNDALLGNWGDDLLSGGSGNNSVKGGWGEDIFVSAASGADRIVGGIDSDTIYAADGDDLDRISCGPSGTIEAPLPDPPFQADAGDKLSRDCSDGR